jgi:hypothetical protein
MNCAVEVDAGCIINIPNFMTIASGIQVILRLLPSTVCDVSVLVLLRMESMKYPIEMASRVGWYA